MSDLDDMKIVAMGDDNGIVVDENEKHVQVVFVAGPGLPAAPDTRFALSVKLARLGLSEVLNEVLRESSNADPRPYQFLVGNRMLTTSLEKYIASQGLTGEEELELVYIEAMPPPERDTSTPQPDWISSVDASLGIAEALLPVVKTDKKKKRKTEEEDSCTRQLATHAVVGSYDNGVRIYAHTAPPANSKEAMATSAKGSCSLVAQGLGHLGPVSSVRVARPLGKNTSEQNPALVVSASHDRSLRLWEFTSAEIPDEAAKVVPSKLRCKGIFDYHVGTVQCVETIFSPNRPGSVADPSLNPTELAAGCIRFVSGGYDGAIAMWLNHKDFLIDPEEVAAKRELQFKGMGRKLKAQKTRATQAAAKTDLTEEESLPHFRPMSVFLGHRGAVSSLCWPTLHHLYSGSHDYTIKHWDLQTSTATHSWSSGHVVNAIDFSTPMNLIASGDQDGYVRFYDPRIGSEEAVTNSTKGSIKACATWVSDVKWAPSVLNAPHLLATASYDGIVKFWDIRSSKPLHSLDTSSERLLAVDWVPAVAPVEGVPAQTYTLVGGTGKVLDRISWKINV